MRVTLLLAAAMLPCLVRADPLDHLRSKDDIGADKVPHVGVSHILVMPVAVPNPGPVTLLSSQQQAELRRFFAPEGGPGTFRYYWQTVSGGRYDPIPTLTDVIDYPDRCPVPGRDAAHCHFSVGDLDLVSNGALGKAFVDLFQRVRDEQGIDLSRFDVNTANGPGSDGYFDGVIVISNVTMFSVGVGLPLAALGNQATVASRPGGGGPSVSCGIVALVPPQLLFPDPMLGGPTVVVHEYGHTLGYVDLYGGPVDNGIMSVPYGATTIDAFSRQQIGWGEVRTIGYRQELDLRPVLHGGPVLRFGSSPRYVLVENRGGPRHAALESSPPGINIYSIDETKLPHGQFGFVDPRTHGLYLPNDSTPFLDVNLPLSCNLATPDQAQSCVLSREGTVRDLMPLSGVPTGFRIRLGATSPDGTIHVSIDGPPPPATADTGCSVARSHRSAPAVPIALLLVLLATVVRARRRWAIGLGRGAAI